MTNVWSVPGWQPGGPVDDGYFAAGGAFSRPAPHTLFEGIHKLPPSHFMLVRPGETPTITRYWDVSVDEEEHDELRAPDLPPVLKTLHEEANALLYNEQNAELALELRDAAGDTGGAR